MCCHIYIISCFKLRHELTLNIWEICAVVYGYVILSSNSKEPLVKAICVMFRATILVCGWG